MKVIVEVLPEARHDLIALLQSRGRTMDDAIDFAITYLEDVERLFVQYKGYPPEFRRVRTTDESERWWRYVNGVWVVYHFAETRGWFGGTTRRITIVGFEPALPAL